MDIYGLLNIKIDLIRDLPLLAERVADYQTEKVVNKNMSKLKQIKEKMYVDKGIDVSQKSIDEIFSKLLRLAEKEDYSTQNWTIRELRIVSYYLMKLRSNQNAYIYAISLLERNWRNIYFNGLVFYVMNSWNSIEPNYRKITCDLIIKKMYEYQGNNKRYLLFKNHANFFDDFGPVRMATLLLQKNIKLSDAPTLIGFKGATFKQSYYSDVIIRYVKKRPIYKIDEIESIFESHSLDRTKKLVLAHLVDIEDSNGDGLRRSQLCRFINRTLGDVSLATTWAPVKGASLEEAQTLNRVMKLVNMWFAQQIIETFFEICVQDRERKDFWLDYVKHISGFKIVGSTSTKRLLQSDNKIGGLFLHHFIETNSYRSQTSALILFIKNKMLVEFSDTGALYAYNQNHPKVKLVTKRAQSLTSINDLKIPTMSMIVELSYWGDQLYNEEGRMTHQGNWQSRLRGWLNQMVLSKGNMSVSFIDEKNDEIFVATPLPDEPIFKPSEDRKPIIEIKPNGPVVKPLYSSEENSGHIEDRKPVIEIKPNGSVVKPLYSSEENVGHIGIIVYSLSYKIYSKYIDTTFRIVANDFGYYIHCCTKNKYAFIGLLKSSTSPVGNIWIKKAKILDWKEIVHFYNSTELIVGYIRIINSRVLFKRSLNESGETKIEF